MNRKFIFKNVLNNINSLEENNSIMEAIEEARVEIENAESYFQCTNDPQLIDYAIYWQEAAKCRYMYLLTKAREKGLKSSL